MGERPPVSEVEAKLLNYLRAQSRKHGRTPRYEVIAKAMGWASIRAVGYRVDALEEKGYLRRLGGHRGLEVIGETRGFSLPILGLVAAGVPLAVGDAGAERFDFEERFGGDDRFMLKVRGNSMIEACIAPGDLIVIQRHPEAEHGDEVVVKIDGELTLKVYHETRNVKWLLPRNKDMPSIRLDELKENQILGVLVGVVRFKR